MRNATAVVLTVVGGVFYAVGGGLVFALAGSIASLGNFSGLGDYGSLITPTNITPTDSSGISDFVYAVGAFGIIAGILIIVGGVLMRSEMPRHRKTGGILAAVMLFVGFLPALGGLIIGLILGAIGCYMGLTYGASRSAMTLGLGPAGSVTLNPRGSDGAGASDSGRGPLNYCIKCGSRLRDGAVFCGACGARVPE
ncbi:MAG: zinc ribbon domain-containing protein [Nitrososphaerales archaeon]